MEVLHVVTGLGDGGAEAVLHRLCSHDRVTQHVVVSLMDEAKYGPLLRAEGVAVHALGMRPGSVSLRGLLRLWQLMGQHRSALVQTWMYHGDLVGGIVARLTGLRSIVWGVHHTTLERHAVKRRTRWVANACALAANWVPAHIVCCAEEAKRVHAGMGYPPDRMSVVANGYDLSRFVPQSGGREALRSAWSVAAGKPLLGMVARFDPQKDHANLIAALGHLSARGVGFRCVLVGPGVDPGNSALRDLLVRHGVSDRVVLVGARDDIPAVMSALDLHVLSSRYGEAFPNVLAEAMACGTPCVTTAVGDAGLIVGETGWVVPPANPERLAVAIEQALEGLGDMPTWRARQADARRRIEREFGVKRMVESYRRIWTATLREVEDGRPRRRPCSVRLAWRARRAARDAVPLRWRDR